MSPCTVMTGLNVERLGSLEVNFSFILPIAGGLYAQILFQNSLLKSVLSAKRAFYIAGG